MARLENRQLLYVGNLGDILKHALLVEVATALARDHAAVTFVDTHAFQLHAPFRDEECRARWEREAGELVARLPAYSRYVDREHISLEKNGHYRCSAGLVVDALGASRAAAILGEANAQSRVVIREQLAAERIERVVVAEDAARVNDESGEMRGPLLLHVDPFRLTPAAWSAIAPGLAKLVARAPEVALVLYRYARNANEPWPDVDALAPSIMPLARTRGGPHDVAVHGSNGLRAIILDASARLGWSDVSTSTP